MTPRTRTTPADSSAIDNALLALLGADPALLALCPNGVYYDLAYPAQTRFVIVSVIDAADVDEFGGRAYEDVLYAIEARMRSTVDGDIAAAAARLDALLVDQPLIVPGYTWMTTYREARVRVTEVDDLDPTIRWYHRGGHYRVQMAIDPVARDLRQLSRAEARAEP